MCMFLLIFAQVNRARNHMTTSHVDLSRNYNDQLADRMFYSTTAINNNGMADSSSTRYSSSSGFVPYNNSRHSSSNTSSEGSIREFVINPDPLDQDGTYSVGIIFDRTVSSTNIIIAILHSPPSFLYLFLTSLSLQWAPNSVGLFQVNLSFLINSFYRCDKSFKMIPSRRCNSIAAI